MLVHTAGYHCCHGCAKFQIRALVPEELRREIDDKVVAERVCQGFRHGEQFLLLQINTLDHSLLPITLLSLGYFPEPLLLFFAIDCAYNNPNADLLQKQLQGDLALDIAHCIDHQTTLKPQLVHVVREEKGGEHRQRGREQRQQSRGGRRDRWRQGVSQGCGWREE